jgi:chromosome segregation ATPase
MDVSQSGELIFGVLYMILVAAGSVGGWKTRGSFKTHREKRDEFAIQLKQQSDHIALLEEQDEAKDRTIAKLQAGQSAQDERIAQVNRELEQALQKVAEIPSLRIEIDSYKKQGDKLQERLDKSQETLDLERARANTAERHKTELQARIDILNEREDRNQHKIVDISAQLKRAELDCAEKENEIAELKRKVRDLERPPPPPTKPPKTLPGPGSKLDEDQEQKIA